MGLDTHYNVLLYKIVHNNMLDVAKQEVKQSIFTAIAYRLKSKG
jgi:hypothetical protein